MQRRQLLPTLLCAIALGGFAAGCGGSGKVEGGDPVTSSKPVTVQTGTATPTTTATNATDQPDGSTTIPDPAGSATGGSGQGDSGQGGG